MVGQQRSSDGSAKSGEMSAAIRMIMRSLEWGQENSPGAIPALVAHSDGSHLAAGRTVVGSQFYSKCSSALVAAVSLDCVSASASA